MDASKLLIAFRSSFASYLWPHLADFTHVYCCKLFSVLCHHDMSVELRVLIELPISIKTHVAFISPVRLLGTSKKWAVYSTPLADDASVESIRAEAKWSRPFPETQQYFEFSGAERTKGDQSLG